MSTTKNIEFHTGETWIIHFITHNSDNTLMTLVGAAVSFRISQGNTPKLTKTIGVGIDISDALNGVGRVVITPTDQTTAVLEKNKSYNYELKVNQTDFISIQAIGILKVLPSLFSV